jgi:hypothetical protein
MEFFIAAAVRTVNPTLIIKIFDVKYKIAMIVICLYSCLLPLGA